MIFRIGAKRTFGVFKRRYRLAGCAFVECTARGPAQIVSELSHTCLNRFERMCGDLTPTLFCATPHLDRLTGRTHAPLFEEV